MLSVKDRVDSGAAWLDEVRPYWFREINPEVLDLSCACDCVMGQIVNAVIAENCNAETEVDQSYYYAIESFAGWQPYRDILRDERLVMSLTESINRGFHDSTDVGSEWKDLTFEWRRAIAGRRVLQAA